MQRRCSIEAKRKRGPEVTRFAADFRMTNFYTLADFRVDGVFFTFLILLLVGVETKGSGVDAEAKAGGRGAVIEDVAEVRVAAAAENLGAHHAV